MVLPALRRSAFFVALFLSLGALAFGAEPRFDYGQMFDLARGVMTRKPARELLNQAFSEELAINPELAARYGFKETKVAFTETQLMLLLQENTDLWDELRRYLDEVPRNADPKDDSEAMKQVRALWKKRFRSILADPVKMESFLQKNNPLEPFVLEMPNGVAGYSEAKLSVNHSWHDGTKLHRANDLEKEVVTFIRKAEKEIVLNVFDFDLMSIVDALVEKKKAGLSVRVGIDSGVIEGRPEVKAVYDRLVKEGVDVQAVNSVGLNHQKLIAIDWSLAGKGRVLMSSGNFTRSCLSRDGDLAGTGIKSKKAIPNANHIITVKSEALALLVNHELTKTLDPEFLLRGREYPLSGAYRILGATIAEKQNWMTIAFSPNGGLKNINQNFIGRVLRQTSGPVYMAQFAYSSQETNDALLERAIREMENGGTFRFLSVGDTSFAMQDWSQFLAMSGYKLLRENDTKKYVELTADESPWVKALGREKLAELRKNIRTAPPVYRTSTIQGPNGESIQLTSKLHHKILVSGEPGKRVGISGSFNFSAGAESNQEYIVAWMDEGIVAKLQAIVETLARQGKNSIAVETRIRNRYRKFEEEVGPDVEAGRAGRSSKNCLELLRPPVVKKAG